jgi:hypothetical protein
MCYTVAHWPLSCDEEANVHNEQAVRALCVHVHSEQTVNGEGPTAQVSPLSWLVLYSSTCSRSPSTANRCLPLSSAATPVQGQATHSRRVRERDASACIRKHHDFALAPVLAPS